MSRSSYFAELKELAREIRQKYGLATPRVLISDLRKICRVEGVTVNLWPLPGMRGDRLKNVRGLYFNEDGDPSIYLARHLPEEQQIFTLAHEIKHHLIDQGQMGSLCAGTNQQEEVEVGAEIFAAELIFPDQDFGHTLTAAGVKFGQCSAEDIIRLKHQSKTTLSFTSLGKKAMILGYSPPHALDDIRWHQLNKQIYGEPPYKYFRRG